MIKLLRSMKHRGFTLIELLVVIAIIGLLAALLFPAIQGALLQAKATQVAAKMGGKGVAGLIYAVSIDRSANSMSEAFPTDADGASTAYFNKYFDPATANTNYIKGLYYSQLAIPGQKTPPKNGTALTAAMNLWNIVTELNTGSNPEIPLFLTANIAGSTLASLAFSEGKDGGAAILNDELAIVIYAQGAAKIFKKEFCNAGTICAGSTYSNAVAGP